MKKELMSIIACPVCRGKLVLNVIEESGEEVVRGTLYCAVCDYTYPIEDTIPNLLPPEAGNRPVQAA
jgi:uncharacterized protein YbaR (Trm112 family)